MLYFVLFFLLVLFGGMDILQVDNKARKIIYYFFIILFFLLGSLRWETGTDWIPYHDLFVHYNTFPEFLIKGYEIGYTTLNFIVKSLTSSYTIFLMVYCFLILRYKSILFRDDHFRTYSLVTLLLFFSYYLGDIFFVRQALAVSLCFYSIKLIIEKRPVKFVIAVFIAGLFHSTAFIFLLAYPVAHLQVRTATLLIMLVASVLIGLALSRTGSVAWIEKIPIISGISRFQEKLEAYSELTQSGETSFGQNTSPLVSFIVGLTRKALVLTPLFIFRNRLRQRFSTFNLLFNLIVFGAMFYFVFGSMSQVFKRGATYFDGAELVCIPMFIYIAKSKNVRLLIYMIICLYALFKFYFIISSFWDLYVPYYSIFDENINRELY